MRHPLLALIMVIAPSSFAQVSEVPLEYTLSARCGEFKFYSAKWPDIHVTIVSPNFYSESRTNGVLNVSSLTPLTPLTPEGSQNENEKKNESKSKHESKKAHEEKLGSHYTDQGFFKEDVKSLNGAVYLEKEYEQKVHVCIVTLNDLGKETSRIRISTKSNEEALSIAREELGFLPNDEGED